MLTRRSSARQRTIERQEPFGLDAAEVRRRLLACEGRDNQLWAISLLVLVAMAMGFVIALLAEDGGPGAASSIRRSIPIFAIGLAALVALLCAYVTHRHRELRQARATLLEQLAHAERGLAEALCDPVTGLFNRRYFDHLLEREARRQERSGGVFTLAIVDVDHFKAINDRFGHRQGDEFLREVAQILVSTFRQTDTVSRYGGDEFAVLMLSTGEDGAAAAMRRVQDVVSRWNAMHGEEGRTMSLSLGFAGHEVGRSFADTLALADKRMYEQKKRSRVLVDHACV